MRDLSKARFEFEASGDRGSALDAWMHEGLAASLLHIAERCSGIAPEIASGLAPSIDYLEEGGRLAPEAFAAYYELVENVTSGALEAVRANIAQIHTAKAPSKNQPLRVLTVGTPEALGLETAFKRRMSLSERPLFGPVGAERAAMFESLLEDGIRLLERGMPEIHAEIRAIIRGVLLAQAPDGSSIEFDGASHYELWGLVLLNPRFHETRLAVAEVLAHECGHSLLFAMMGRELLVHNPYEDRYPSPLRPDPRPMDGIFHAAFVSARMALTMEGLAASGILSMEEQSAALKAAERARAHFASADCVLREHGRLTETGREIIENARAWIGRTSVFD